MIVNGEQCVNKKRSGFDAKSKDDYPTQVKREGQRYVFGKMRAE